jgi:hypothetical protein
MAGIKGKSFSVSELAAAGVKRISLATSLYRAAMTGFLDAVRELKDTGQLNFLDRCVTTSRAKQTDGNMSRVIRQSNPRSCLNMQTVHDGWPSESDGDACGRRTTDVARDRTLRLGAFDSTQPQLCRYRYSLITPQFPKLAPTSC